MLADWEIEIGGDALIIDAAWPGFIDLRKEPTRAAELAECREWPELIAPLTALNSADSPLWTSKCDAWTLDNFAAEDRDEYAARSEETHAVACYIDLLAWSDHDAAVAFCRAVVKRLTQLELGSSRIDLIVRRANLPGGREGFGITAYAAGCGSGPASAREQLAAALAALVNCSAFRVESR